MTRCRTRPSTTSSTSVLADLVAEARRVLGDAFVGAYLQGSFALGAADLASDCDFLVVTGRAGDRRGVRRARRPARRAARPGRATGAGTWRARTPCRPSCAAWPASGRPWPYIDHGSRELRRDTHCNSEVARWILHEHGVTLAGPPARHVVDAVPAEALRARMRAELPGLLAGLESWIDWDVAWCQRYVVTTYCRVLATLATGRVLSKPDALRWAGDALDRRWRPLLEQRPRRPGGVRPGRAPAGPAASRRRGRSRRTASSGATPARGLTPQPGGLASARMTDSSTEDQPQARRRGHHRRAAARGPPALRGQPARRAARRRTTAPDDLDMHGGKPAEQWDDEELRGLSDAIRAPARLDRRVIRARAPAAT